MRIKTLIMYGFEEVCIGNEKEKTRVDTSKGCCSSCLVGKLCKVLFDDGELNLLDGFGLLQVARLVRIRRVISLIINGFGRLFGIWVCVGEGTWMLGSLLTPFIGFRKGVNWGVLEWRLRFLSPVWFVEKFGFLCFYLYYKYFGLRRC